MIDSFFCSISSAWLKQSHLCSHNSWVSNHRPEERSSHLNRLTNAEGWLAWALWPSHCIDTQLNRDCESLDWLPRQPQWEKLALDRGSSPRLFWRSGLDLNIRSLCVAPNRLSFAVHQGWPLDAECSPALTLLHAQVGLRWHDHAYTYMDWHDVC